MKGVKRKSKFVQQVKNTPNNRLEKNKEVSLDTPLHNIQKHYEFYLANKIKSYRYILYLIWLILKVYFLIESL